MYSHTSVGANDLARSRAFYDAVLAPLGLEPRYEFGEAVGYTRSGEHAQFWVMRPFDGGKAVPGNGSMVAFVATARAQVDACHAAAMAQGGADEGEPGLRPHYHPDYYGAYFRDPDGNKICVVSHHAE